tara:strand:- start:277 stop:480 length:204 start_codon:yes stop_codon:yes gene_type:complete
MNIFYKLAGIFGVIFSIFFIGKKSGKNQIKNQINKETLNDVRKSKEINKKVSAMSDDELRDILLGKK